MTYGDRSTNNVEYNKLMNGSVVYFWLLI